MLNDDQFQTMLVMGFLFRRLGLNDKAARLYRALLSIRPGAREVLLPAAASSLAEGRPAEALDRLQTLDGLDAQAGAGPISGVIGPENFEKPVRQLLKAQALLALERPEEAKASAQEYLRLMQAAGPAALREALGR